MSQSGNNEGMARALHTFVWGIHATCNTYCSTICPDQVYDIQENVCPLSWTWHDAYHRKKEAVLRHLEEVLSKSENKEGMYQVKQHVFLQ